MHGTVDATVLPKTAQTCTDANLVVLIVVSTRVLRGSKSTKINSGRVFAPDPTGAAYSAPLGPLAGG